MCLIVFAYKVDPEYPLILAANRDEYYARETTHCDWWQEQPELLAGKDLVAGGTWMGLHKAGRFAAITNFREGSNNRQYLNSRGDLTKSFLLGTDSAENYIRTLSASAQEYAGFNLLLGDKQGLYYYSNRGANRDEDRSNQSSFMKLEPGIYGLSNHSLDTPWPKVTRVKDNFTSFINNRSLPDPDHKALIQLMADQHEVPREELPHTGVSEKMELGLAKIFIQMAWKGYGTRATSSLWCHQNGEISFTEQNYSINPEGESIKDGMRQFRCREIILG